MTHLQERWEGVSLPGEHLLEHWVGGDEVAGFFEASPMPDGRRALVKLVPDSAVDAAAQLVIWARTRDLRHPHLRELLDFGRAELGDEIVLYAVFEPSDDTLASALANGQLSEAEAREVLEAMLDALRYLRSQGLSHPAIYPGQVVAIGDRIKLSTEGLTQAGDSTTPLADDLRAFWYKISPSPVPRSADIFAQVLGPDAPSAPSLPAPPPAMPAPPLALPAQPPERAAERAPTSAEPVSANTGPAAVAAPKGIPKWTVVGAAAVVLLILGLRFLRGPESPAPASATPQAAAPSTAPVSIDPPVKATSTEVGKAMWRVIAFTYRTHAAAAHKAEQVNRGHPDLAATVFSPRERTGYYLVSLGGRMTRDDAIRVQRKARAERVARDAYVQNYLE